MPILTASKASRAQAPSVSVPLHTSEALNKCMISAKKLPASSANNHWLSPGKPVDLPSWQAPPVIILECGPRASFYGVVMQMFIANFSGWVKLYHTTLGGDHPCAHYFDRKIMENHARWTLQH